MDGIAERVMPAVVGSVRWHGARALWLAGAPVDGAAAATSEKEAAALRSLRRLFAAMSAQACACVPCTVELRRRRALLRNNDRFTVSSTQ